MTPLHSQILLTGYAVRDGHLAGVKCALRDDPLKTEFEVRLHDLASQVASIFWHMRAPHEIVPQWEIASVWGDADFGTDAAKRDVLGHGLLKVALGYHVGSTMQAILKDLDLIKVHTHRPNQLKDRGRNYLWALHGKGQP